MATGLKKLVGLGKGCVRIPLEGTEKQKAQAAASHALFPLGLQASCV